MAKRDWVTASEIGAYTYCPRRFWLEKVKRVRTGDGRALADGVRNHHHHGRRYDLQLRVRRAACWTMAAAAILILVVFVFVLGVV